MAEPKVPSIGLRAAEHDGLKASMPVGSCVKCRHDDGHRIDIDRYLALTSILFGGELYVIRPLGLFRIIMRTNLAAGNRAFASSTACPAKWARCRLQVRRTSQRSRVNGP